ncbi:MAG: Hsp70 family protein [Myxococcales bacterium]|nr:Hsp70 family protein [Myxococcales bacterium]
MGTNLLTMPRMISEHLCSPAHLSILRRQDIAEFLRNVRSWSVGHDDRAKLEQLEVLVDDALGFTVFEVIEKAKRRLSSELETEVSFEYPSIALAEHLTRPEFDALSRQETDAILDCLDTTLDAAGVFAADIELVCCTGGTAKVTRIADEIRRRFGDARVKDWKNFHSVVEGLAVHARSIARGEADPEGGADPGSAARDSGD